MDVWIAVVALVLGVGGTGILHASKSERWPRFRSESYFGLVSISCALLCVCAGLWFAWLFPEQVGQFLAAGAVICGCAVGLLAFVWFADRLR